MAVSAAVSAAVAPSSAAGTAGTSATAAEVRCFRSSRGDRPDSAAWSASRALPLRCRGDTSAAVVAAPPAALTTTCSPLAARILRRRGARALCWHSPPTRRALTLGTMAALVALSALAQGKPPPALIALDDESAADVMRGPLDVLLMFETSWCEATVKKTPRWATLPKRLIGRGCPGPGTAWAVSWPPKASGTPAGRSLSQHFLPT